MHNVLKHGAIKNWTFCTVLRLPTKYRWFQRLRHWPIYAWMVKKQNIPCFGLLWVKMKPDAKTWIKHKKSKKHTRVADHPLNNNIHQETVIVRIVDLLKQTNTVGTVLLLNNNYGIYSSKECGEIPTKSLRFLSHNSRIRPVYKMDRISDHIQTARLFKSKTFSI